jgi:hypothetical protein
MALAGLLIARLLGGRLALRRAAHAHVPGRDADYGPL